MTRTIRLEIRFPHPDPSKGGAPVDAIRKLLKLATCSNPVSDVSDVVYHKETGEIISNYIVLKYDVGIEV